MLRLLFAALRRRSTTFFIAMLAALFAVNDGSAQTPDLRIQGTAIVDEAAGSVTVPVYLDGVGGGTFPFTVTVQFTTVDNTATAPTDYTTTSGTLTFPPGTSRQYITVPIINNNVTGSNKDFYIQLSNAVNGVITVPQCDVTIIEDAPPLPTVQFSAPSYCISEYGKSATITATLNTSSSNTVTVNYATSAGTATPGTDYEDTSGTLTFPAGSTSQTFSVTVKPNLLGSGDKTVTLTLSSPSNATLGTPNPATLNIWDNPPTLTVSASPDPICAGALDTPVHQSKITVSLINSHGGVAGIPLTLATTAGTLDNTSGKSDSTGSFTATLTSNHKASGHKAPYHAVITVVANGQLAQMATVRFDKTDVTLTSDVTIIPAGGTANLTATLAFQGQAVAGHNLLFTVAGVWDAANNPVTGADQSAYGHFDSNVRVATNDAGIGTAVWKAGEKKGKVEIEVSDESVQVKPGWTHPNADVSLQEKKVELKIKIIVNGKPQDVNDKNERFLVGEVVPLVLESNMAPTSYKWQAEGEVFGKYTDFEGSPGVQPKGAYEKPANGTADYSPFWYGTQEGTKKVTCEVVVDGKTFRPFVFVEIYRPQITKFTPNVGEMRNIPGAKNEKTKDGRERLVALTWTFGLFLKNDALYPGITLQAEAVMPKPFADADSIWGYTQLVNLGRKLYFQGKKTATMHSAYGNRPSLNGDWCLDNNVPYNRWLYKIEPKTQRLRKWAVKESKFLPETPGFPKDSPFWCEDRPFIGWEANLRVPGDTQRAWIGQISS